MLSSDKFFLVVCVAILAVIGISLYVVVGDGNQLTKEQTHECIIMNGTYLPIERVCLAPGTTIQLAPRNKQ
jgi:hypothetical protein